MEEAQKLWDEKIDLQNALAAVCAAAAKQIAGMGRGKEPSPALQEALDAAADLLGYDPTLPEPTDNERELAELRHLAGR